MRLITAISIFFCLAIIPACVSPFIPEINESQELMVVEGLITDQPGIHTVRLSKSVPLDEMSRNRPLIGCSVRIIDELGNSLIMEEVEPGVYRNSDPAFAAERGIKYQLRIIRNDPEAKNKIYESIPMEMGSAPAVDSLYYEKITLLENPNKIPLKEGCQIYLDAYDPSSDCRFLRWTFTETWEIRIPFDVQNKICWTSAKSGNIMIRNLSGYSDGKISRYPVTFLNNESDRLDVKYSILVNQYSLSEDEYDFWSRLKSVSESTGTLYDITPASVAGNVFCKDDPGEMVMGFFSVSSVSSRRLFIEDSFAGKYERYSKCATDSVYGTGPITGLNRSVWVLYDYPFFIPPLRIVTDIKECADCTVRGSRTKPPFWEDDKK